MYLDFTSNVVTATLVTTTVQLPVCASKLDDQVMRAIAVRPSSRCFTYSVAVCHTSRHTRTSHTKHQRHAAVSCDVDNATHGACRKVADHDMIASRQEHGHCVTSTRHTSYTFAVDIPLTKATYSTRRPPHSHRENCGLHAPCTRKKTVSHDAPNDARRRSHATDAFFPPARSRDDTARSRNHHAVGGRDNGDATTETRQTAVRVRLGGPLIHRRATRA